MPAQSTSEVTSADRGPEQFLPSRQAGGARIQRKSHRSKFFSAVYPQKVMYGLLSHTSRDLLGEDQREERKSKKLNTCLKETTSSKKGDLNQKSECTQEET